MQVQSSFCRHRLLILLVLFYSLSAGGTPAGEIALSFDDAPRGKQQYLSGLERTEMLINKLDSLEIDQVVFFCATEQLPWHHGRRRLQMYGEAGHLLGNHTHSHQHPGKIGCQAFIRDIRQAHDSLKGMTGFVRWFRYPLLDEGRSVPVRDSLRSALKELGYRNGYVTIDNYDWYLERAFQQAIKNGRTVNFDRLRDLYVSTLWDAIQFYDSIAREALGRSPRHVLLLHENDLAALFIDELVTHLRENGWKIISPVAAYEDSIALYVPDVLMNNQGRVAAIAREKGFKPRRLVHEAEDEAFLDSLIEKSGVFQ
ncbi:MAG: polysaccharide deacetylase family protein [Candidatus Zixiibacteriota bacterium]|nr:MAG: polysaccharide deacetylase family protein [candidate division Zixibacteria bacterium]